MPNETVVHEEPDFASGVSRYAEVEAKASVITPNGGFFARLLVEPEQDPESPRSWDNMCKICVRDHRRYSFPNELEFDFDAEDQADKETQADKIRDMWVFPLSYYEHGPGSSRFSLGSSEAVCQWDGVDGVGFIAVPKGNFPDEKEAYAQADGEIDTYNRWLRGEIYDATVQVAKAFTKEWSDGSVEYGWDWESAESCGGFFGYDHEESGLLDFAATALQREFASWCEANGYNLAKMDRPTFK